eukprot:6184843-Pleurochrysis_carterae.AAC.1
MRTEHAERRACRALRSCSAVRLWGRVQAAYLERIRTSSSLLREEACSSAAAHAVDLTSS